ARWSCSWSIARRRSPTSAAKTRTPATSGGSCAGCCAACRAAWWSRAARARTRLLDGVRESRYSLGPLAGTVAKLVRQGTANPSFPGSNPGGASTPPAEHAHDFRGGAPWLLRVAPRRFPLDANQVDDGREVQRGADDGERVEDFVIAE